MPDCSLPSWQTFQLFSPNGFPGFDPSLSWLSRLVSALVKIFTFCSWPQFSPVSNSAKQLKAPAKTQVGFFCVVLSIVIWRCTMLRQALTDSVVISIVGVEAPQQCYLDLCTLAWAGKNVHRTPKLNIFIPKFCSVLLLEWSKWIFPNQQKVLL